ncbi:TDP-N-acetylfucosamine:lipid II N-acetylfucosaminyltransferase family protein [Vibrio cholerae]|uniref:TDP-N-acetylfucosamine:lipid II N-acetylfucosaminyltransferase n=2 Tax=Vibrio cholerae TaxID=666 RepID=UPI0005B3403C|nr:TDP-N-acetylfucosamine:lipid II N-acetylfucosaminyltransferase [Vibrio cholerae]
MSNKFLHIGTNGNFIKSFIEFIKEEFDFNEHYFLITSDNNNNPIYSNATYSPRTVFSRLKYYFEAIIRMHQAKKIVLHGIFDIKLNFILFLMPWLLKKCHWVIWGGDLYIHVLGEKNLRWKFNEFIRGPVIRNMGYLLTYIPGDVNLARECYRAKGYFKECLMYTSNIIDPHVIGNEIKQSEIKKDSSVSILVGNSADPSNHHIETFKKLLPYKDENIRIFAPLSYGDDIYANEIIEKGKEWFGDKFFPITSIMEKSEYLKFLNTIDIAIFNHKRQQAMGNTITLLGMGKTVYIRTDVTQWDFFKNKRITCLNIEDFDIKLISKQQVDENIINCMSYFNKENLVEQYTGVFYDA